MSLPRLWAFLAVALPVVAGLVAPLQTVDLTYHLRAGAQIANTGSIPSTDSWTFTAAGLPWTDQQWAAQVLLAVVDRFGAWTGLVVFRAALVGLIFGCLFAIARRRGLSARTSALLTLAAFIVAAPALALRPQLIAMALFALALLLVSERRRHPRAVWVVPLLAAAWANVHGSFFLAPLVLGLAWLEDLHDRAPRRQETLAAVLASAALACATPFGSGVWNYVVGLSTTPQVTSGVSEWQRTTPFEPAGLLFYASFVAVAVLVYRRGRSAPWSTLMWLIAFAAIGAYAVRGIGWWSLGAVVPIAGLLAASQAPRPAEVATRPALRRLNAVVSILLAAVGVAVLPAWRPIDPATGAPDGILANAPPGINAALRNVSHPGDRLLNPQPWGSWFEFALPDLRIAVDSRVEMFPAQVWSDYDRVVSGGPGWQAQVDAWGVSLAVVAAGQAGLRERLLEAGWRSVYRDADGSVLVRPGR